MTSIIYSPETLDDIQRILVFLAGQDPELVGKFETDYRKALQRIRDFPRAWPKVSKSVRVKVISKRFRYGIYYQYFKRIVFLGAVVHLKQRPSIWKGRFRK